MKYNKQLFDNIQKEYNQLLELAEFIYDQLLNDQTDNKRYETLSNLDLYVQGLLANIILDNDPKNPALFNMMKKLTKYDNFYQGINLDDWFHEKDKVLKNITKKINQATSETPKMLQISAQMDKKLQRTELAYQLLESIISLLITVIPEQESYEDVEESIINKYLKKIYDNLK